MPQSIEAKKYLANIDEEEIWQNAFASEEGINTENYISKYPKGKYIINAISRKNELETLNMQKAYDGAVSSNTSYAWKRFLEDYPNHSNKI